jgi:hypothetical protein
VILTGPVSCREVGARKACAVYIQIGVMERDVHGAWGEPDVPAGKSADAVDGRAPVSRKSKRSANDYKVIIDMPDPLPVTQGELELLESELAEFIAELLKK